MFHIFKETQTTINLLIILYKYVGLYVNSGDRILEYAKMINDVYINMMAAINCFYCKKTL